MDAKICVTFKFRNDNTEKVIVVFDSILFVSKRMREKQKLQNLLKLCSRTEDEDDDDDGERDV
ncbi:hypothetical protein QR98_0025640 [Sarcoptes scabiei]|uniref:Uncharacterized protein n=1 Tax=Sarcoptes scabiei TaxID=52283 RepID=A0A131ZZL1_SARSC|nr:hypothetical protein QR98_0025640 [Sarcoptes scabiei]